MTRDRQEQHLGEPPDPVELKRFPSSRLVPTKSIYRFHRAARPPWSFSTSGAGRFDLPGPEGTCYAALDPAVAFIEVFYGFSIVPVEELVDVVVSTMRASRALRLADCTSPRAANYGITSEINTIIEYALTQRWAGAFEAAGFEGVRYWARHDPGRGHALALFGPPGEPEDRPVTATQPLDAALQSQVTRRYGIVFLGTDV